MFVEDCVKVPEDFSGNIFNCVCGGYRNTVFNRME